MCIFTSKEPPSLVNLPGACTAISRPKPTTWYLFKSTLVSGSVKADVKPKNWSVRTDSELLVEVALYDIPTSKVGQPNPCIIKASPSVKLTPPPPVEAVP